MRFKILISLLALSTMNLFADTQQLIDGNINKKVIVNSGHQVQYPTDVDFNPQVPGQLWVLNHGLETGGTTITIDNPGTTAQLNDYRRDGAAGHFMVYASALAFGDTTWATAQDYFNANRAFFGGWCGPSLWPSDMSVYAIYGNPPSGGANGSHYDMVHQSPYSSGIAHEKDLTYWVNDGEYGSISKYDFGVAHIAGGADHSDGKVYRYVDVPYEMNAGIPAHMVIQGNWIYYINPGTKSVNRLDITTGTKGKSLAPTSNGGEQLAEFVEMNGGIWEQFITEGLVSPSGIDIQGDYMIVSDNANGSILLYNISTDSPVLVTTLQTDALSIMGVKFDAEGDIYYVDNLGHEVVKLEGNSGINFYTSTSHLNYDPSGDNQVKIMIENNTDSEITISVGTNDHSVIAESKTKKINASITSPETIVPITVAAGEQGELDVNVDIMSGNGIFEVETTIMIVENDNEDYITSSKFTVSSFEIPLIYVYDDSPQNMNNANLAALLNTTSYSDYIEMNTIDFQKYAMRVIDLKTVIWNAGSFGTTNAQEYSKFQKLRDNGTSLLYLGDGPLFLVGNFSPESNFNLNAFGADYEGQIFQGFSTGGPYLMNGVSGDDVTSEYQNISNSLTLYPTQNGTSAWPTSYLKPTVNSFSIFNHSVSTDSVIAVRNETDNSRSVVQSFNMYNITDINQRTNIFKSIMDWLTYKDITGIFELSGYEPVGIYPNPTTDYIQFENLEITASMTINLLDIAGNNIRNVDATNRNINVSDLSTGTYFLMIQDSNGIKFAKFVKQ